MEDKSAVKMGYLVSGGCFMVAENSQAQLCNKC
jgi:hypothetical protein